MIEGPLTGATESDAATAADVTALAAAVAGNTTALGTKAAATDLATAEGTISAHTGQIASLNNSYNNLGNSFYTKVFTDALLSGKQAVVGDGDLTIARTSGLQTALDDLATDVALKCNSSLFTSVTNTLDGLIVTDAASISANTTALADKQDNAYGATLNAASFASKTGTWGVSATTTSWSSDLHINEVGNVFTGSNNANGVNTATITYTIPTAFVGGSVFLNHLAWSIGGYFDVYLTKSSNADEVFSTRVNAYSAVTLNGTVNFDSVRVDCIASGYSQYDQITIKCRKGKVHLMGLGFTLEVDRPVAGIAVVHSDNVFGDPASLSDTRLKHNQAPVPSATMSAIFDAIETKEYEFISKGVDTEGNALPSERRVGFIADDVKTALPETWTNIVGSKPVNNAEYLTLDYSRLVCVLWGTVKELRARVAALEA